MKRTARCRRFVQTKSLSPHLKYYKLHSLGNSRRMAVNGALEFLYHLSDLLVCASSKKDSRNPENKQNQRNRHKQRGRIRVAVVGREGKKKKEETISSSVDNGGEIPPPPPL